MLFEILTDDDPESVHKEWLAVYDNGEYLAFNCEYLRYPDRLQKEEPERKTWHDAGLSLDKKHIPALIKGLQDYLDSGK